MDLIKKHSVNGNIEIPNRGDAPFSILRIYAMQDKQTLEGYQEQISRCIGLVRKYPGLFESAWLTTRNMLFLPKIHTRWAKVLKTGFDALTQEGLKVSLEMAPVFGHRHLANDPLYFQGDISERMWDMDDAFPTDGSPFCSGSGAFRKHLREAMAAYLNEFKPFAVYLDDDIRLNNHGRLRNGCFCPACLEKFSLYSGRTWSREALKKELTGHRKASIVRQQWTDFNQMQLADFMDFACRQIRKCSPGSIAALENCNPTDQYNGRDNIPVYHAMEKASERKVHIRVGGGTWDDYDPWELLRKGFLAGTAANEAKESGSVAMTYNEMEIAPCSTLSKSPHGMALECALAMAYGVQGITLQWSWLLRTRENKYIYPFFAYMHRWIPYLKTLSRAWEGSRFAGMSMYQPGNNLSSRVFHEYERKNRNWWCVMFSDELRALTSSGIPVTWDRTLEKEENVPVLLTLECVEGLTKEEFKRLLQRGVMLTGEAFHYLQSKRLTGFTGVRSIRTGHSIFKMSDHPFNAGFEGELWSSQFYGTGFKYTFSSRSKAQALLNRFYPERDSTSEECAVWVLETSDGSRMAVFGNNGTFSMHQNPSSLHQMYEVLDFLGKRKAPVRAGMYERIALIPFASKQTGKTRGVTIVNCSIYPLKETKILLRDPESTDFRLMIPGGKMQTVEAAGTGELGEYLLTLPGLAAWHIMTVFCNA